MKLTVIYRCILASILLLISPLGMANQAKPVATSVDTAAAMKPDKRKQLMQALAPYRKQLMDMRQQYLTKSDKLRQQVTTKGATWEQIKPLADDVNQILSQMYLIKVKARFDVYQKTGILLPDRKRVMKRVSPASKPASQPMPQPSS